MTAKRRIRPATYSIVDRAVEEGVGYGWRRAHKHTDKPAEDAIREEIQRAVMNQLDEVIQWEDA